jgi:nucleotide-binding universal stress UspA family protein
MIKHILVATEGSDAAAKAYAFAVDIAKKYDAELHVLAVARPPDFGEDVETEAIIENSKKHYQKVLAPLRAQAPSLGVRVHFEVAVGHPAEQIMRHAEQHNADVIVIGHRGKTFIERWRLGSITHRVLQYAHCPVIVVR